MRSDALLSPMPTGRLAGLSLIGLRPSAERFAGAGSATGPTSEGERAVVERELSVS